RTVCLLAALQAANVTAADTSGDWQQFRGPRGDGVSIDAQPPTTWSAEHNIRWKTPLGPAFALKLERARGDVTATHRLWRVPEYAQSIGSGLLLDGVYYMANAGPGIVECLDAAPGRVLWKDR